jgi:flagellar motor switch protein FliN/FliY
MADMGDETAEAAEQTRQPQPTPAAVDDSGAGVSPDPPRAPQADAAAALDEVAAEATASGPAPVAGAGNLEAEIAAALAAAQAQAAEMGGQTPQTSEPAPEGPSILGVKTVGDVSGATPLEIPQFPETSDEQALANLDLLDDVELNVKIELGRTHMYIEDVLRLGVGSVVELDKLAGDPVDIYVNDRLVARGEVLVLNDNFCVRVNEIISPTLEEEEKQSA